MKNKTKIILFTVFVVAFVTASVIYREYFKENLQDPKLPKLSDGKKVVTVWVKDDIWAGMAKKDADKYNVENKDNIYIDFHYYSHDYYNMLRISMLSKNKPDIYQFGFYDYLENHQIYSLNELGVNTNSINKNDIFYYNNDAVGIKVFGDNVKLAWNKNLLKSCGINPDIKINTWAELINICKIIKQKKPDIIPLEFPASNFYELKISVGENCLSNKSIYTSFWDYKKGKYDFDNAKEMLDIYSSMYKMNLIPEKFDAYDKIKVRNDFSAQKTAFIISTYTDKSYFLKTASFTFNAGISDLPLINSSDVHKYYFTGNLDTFVVNNSYKDISTAGKVYTWLADEYEKDIAGYKKSSTGLSGYENSDNFTFEEKDPTDSLRMNFVKANQIFYDAIKGKKKSDDAAADLNKYFADYCNEVKKINKNYFDFYVDKE